MNIIKLNKRQLRWINKLQDAKTFPTGSANKKDDRINKIINKIYNGRYKTTNTRV
jgi:hypothetical protein